LGVWALLLRLAGPWRGVLLKLIVSVAKTQYGLAFASAPELPARKFACDRSVFTTVAKGWLFMNRIVNMPALRTAVHAATRFRLPGQTATEDVAILPYFTGVGFALGFGAWLIAALLINVTSSSVAAVLGSIAIVALYHWATEARNLENLVTISEQLNSPSPGSLGRYTSIFTIQAAVLLRGIFIGLLIVKDCQLWLIAAAVLAWTLYAQLLADASANATTTPAQVGGLWPAWVVAAAVTLPVAALLNEFAAGLFALVLAWLLASTAGHAIAQHLPASMHTAGRRAVLESAELLLLFYGMLFCHGTV